MDPMIPLLLKLVAVMSEKERRSDAPEPPAQDPCAGCPSIEGSMPQVAEIEPQLPHEPPDADVVEPEAADPGADEVQPPEIEPGRASRQGEEPVEPPSTRDSTLKWKVPGSQRDPGESEIEGPASGKRPSRPRSIKWSGFPPG